MGYRAAVMLWGICLFMGCSDFRAEKIVNDWVGREIVFPDNEAFSHLGMGLNDSVNYTILTYVDSAGCLNCKMKLSEWKLFMALIDSLGDFSVRFLFYAYPSDVEELRSILQRNKFNQFVYIDENDSLNKLNHFPHEIMLQTFLLNENNKVLAMGNPVYSSKISELYVNIISGKNVEWGKLQKKMTEVSVSNSFIDIGEFSWEKAKHCIFTLYNTGENMLVIDDVVTSCGCTSVEYSKEPVSPGKSLDIIVTYKADHPEHFNKTITVYCNSSASPLRLKIMGNAK